MNKGDKIHKVAVESGTNDYFYAAQALEECNGDIEAAIERCSEIEYEQMTEMKMRIERHRKNNPPSSSEGK